ncbi:hypothetical protein GC176_16690 [bacterium]|nr:hypothetical protein [bacterium]
MLRKMRGSLKSAIGQPIIDRPDICPAGQDACYQRIVMQLQIRLFARARDLAGADFVPVNLPEQATVADLRTALGEQYPALTPLLPHLHVAIGTDYANDSTALTAVSSVTCFPPVSGG